uniref:hypothetical protein n=1 Tax=Serratia proteamaculans TaxID=28151 RepID=UPI001F4BE43C|nr:hypothetical protein [Serratia proteamaculans]
MMITMLLHHHQPFGLFLFYMWLDAVFYIIVLFGSGYRSWRAFCSAAATELARAFCSGAAYRSWRGVLFGSEPGHREAGAASVRQRPQEPGAAFCLAAATELVRRSFAAATGTGRGVILFTH